MLNTEEAIAKIAAVEEYKKAIPPDNDCKIKFFSLIPRLLCSYKR
jgi:hypothetical protein